LPAAPWQNIATAKKYYLPVCGKNSKMPGKFFFISKYSRSFLLLFYVFLLLNCFFFACSSHKLAGRFEDKNLLFSSAEFRCSLQLPKVDGWRHEENRKENGDIIFEIYNPSKILYVFLAAESLNSSLEDYFLLVKMSNKFDQREDYRFFGKSNETINEREALRFVYSAQIATDDIGKDDFTYTTVLFKNGPLNYRLMVYTLTDAFERKKEMIDEIVHGFRIME
jgi:hypothetical protein